MHSSSGRRNARCLIHAIVSCILLTAAADAAFAAPPTASEAAAFIDAAEARLLDLSVKAGRASWVQSTYITDDTEALAAEANQALIDATVELAAQATRFSGMKLPYDVEADFVPVTPILDVSNVLTINPDVINVKTLKEFVDLVKANPGKYNYASTGNGTGTHMAFAEMNAKLGLNMVHVPYKGGPEAIQAVLKGETCCIMNQVQTVLPHARAGKVRLLAVTTGKRVPAVQDVPTIAESGLPGTQGFDSSTWFALFAPKGTDAAVVARLNVEMGKPLGENFSSASRPRLPTRITLFTLPI